MARLIRGQDPNSDYSYTIQKVFRSDKVDDQNTMDFMVITWARSGRPVLEKRRVWHGKKGGYKPKKLVGMNSDDIKFVVEHYNEISGLLK